MLIMYVFKKNGKTHHYYYYCIIIIITVLLLLLYKHIYIYALYIYIYTIVNIWISPYYMAIPIYFFKKIAHLNLGRTCQDDPRDILGIRQVLQFSTLSKILGEYVGNILFIYGNIYIYTYLHIIYIIYIIYIYTYIYIYMYISYIYIYMWHIIYGNLCEYIYIIKREYYILTIYIYIYMGTYGNDDT